ncbi:hypothetical protein HY947_00025 [Candidatus Gottesmanbacteria bacterium]|nr:hypothetical protein [Candidatus Gottesmanbacteria bacterium]
MIETGISEFEQMGNDPAFAVREAMTEAVALCHKDAIFFEHAQCDEMRSFKLSAVDDYADPERKMGIVTSAVTHELCERASMFTLCHLHDRYESLFSSYLLLVSHIGGEKGFRVPWLTHVAFLVQSRDGLWFAGSPANHHPVTEHQKDFRQSNALTAVHLGKNLDEVLSSLQQIEGGEWNDADYIQQTIPTISHWIFRSEMREDLLYRDVYLPVFLRQKEKNRVEYQCRPLPVDYGGKMLHLNIS